MIKPPTFLTLLVVLTGLALPAAQKPADPAAAAVINAVENMHSRSTSSSDVVSQALLGDNVRILKKERNADGEDWYEVETPDTYRAGSSLRPCASSSRATSLMPPPGRSSSSRPF